MERGGHVGELPLDVVECLPPGAGAGLVPSTSQAARDPFPWFGPARLCIPLRAREPGPSSKTSGGGFRLWRPRTAAGLTIWFGRPPPWSLCARMVFDEGKLRGWEKRCTGSHIAAEPHPLGEGGVYPRPSKNLFEPDPRFPQPHVASLSLILRSIPWLGPSALCNPAVRGPGRVTSKMNTTAWVPRYTSTVAPTPGQQNIWVRWEAGRNRRV